MSQCDDFNHDTHWQCPVCDEISECTTEKTGDNDWEITFLDDHATCCRINARMEMQKHIEHLREMGYIV